MTKMAILESGNHDHEHTWIRAERLLAAMLRLYQEAREEAVILRLERDHYLAQIQSSLDALTTDVKSLKEQHPIQKMRTAVNGRRTYGSRMLAIYEAVKEHQPIIPARICDITGLDMPGVSSTLKRLESEGLVRRDGKAGRSNNWVVVPAAEAGKEESDGGKGRNVESPGQADASAGASMSGSAGEREGNTRTGPTLRGNVPSNLVSPDTR